MAKRKPAKRVAPPALPHSTALASPSTAHRAMLPIGAILLAGSIGAMAQDSTGGAARVLPTVTVTENAETPEGKGAIRATTSTIGKGNQQLRDIPQSVTVVTEKLIDDRNLDTLKDVLHSTAGITFMAAEGGEEDIRLRGFSLATTGDIFVDGMRDPAFYDRDTFANDRIELLRGSASMLFGHGSTGGAVNQVTKQARAIDQHEVTTTLGSHNYRRVTGDFNIRTGENAGLRLNAMVTKADNNGAGSSIDKAGIAGTYRWGIGTQDEFAVSLYHLDNRNGINYGLPWIRPNAASAATDQTTIKGLEPDDYYGLANDRNNGKASHGTLSHIHRFEDGAELKTQLRQGTYTRDLRSGTVRFAGTTPSATSPLTNPVAVTQATFGPGTVFNRGGQFKIQDFDSTYAQSDFSRKFDALGIKHELLTGIDLAREEKKVHSALTVAQGGASLVKPQTRAGTPDDGASVVDNRVFRAGNQFESQGWGVYVQDLFQIAPAWKVLAGLRYDSIKGDYDVLNPATGAVTSTFQQKINEWSKRVGVLYQPNELHSYQVSYGTSFNTSGDTYSYSAQTASTDPESSRNFEIGAKLDSADKRFTTRLAIFHSAKLNERNTDPDTAATQQLLTGKRHTAGFEIDLTGRLTSQWEIYGSYMWMPVARVDAAAPCPPTGACLQGSPGNRVGERPGLTPRHSGTVWTTHQLTPQWRVGGGLNFRSKQSPANQVFTAPSFVTGDLMAEYAINETFVVKANLSNITDKYYADTIYQGHYIPGTGRNFQVTLTAKF